MNPAKIRLSPKEMELVINADWILTKNTVLQKVKLLLEELLNQQQELLNSSTQYLPSEILIPGPKISKGENYKGLPYLVLDQPRHFDKENVFAIRTMFWWGNFFSTTLHLSGTYKKLYKEKIIDSFTSIQEHDYFICIHEDEWEHHFEEDYYIPIKKLTQQEFAEHINAKNFLKLAQKTSLRDWDNVQGKLFTEFRQILQLLIRN